MLSIVSDSSFDLPRELIDKHDIHVVPLHVNIGQNVYTEGLDITPQEFYHYMAEAQELPKTSQPTPAAFADSFKKLSPLGHVLCLTISSKLSGTYQSACLAKTLADVPVTVFDTLAGSLGHGLQVLKAIDMAQKGFSVNEIVERLTAYKKDMTILILLDTLENIVKGGRLNKFQGSLAKILNIKVLLHNIEGAVDILEKVHGKKRFLNRTIEIIAERKKDFSDTYFGITHVNNSKDVEFLKSLINEKFHPRGILINEMGPTMATYAGEGGIILSF